MQYHYIMIFFHCFTEPDCKFIINGTMSGEVVSPYYPNNYTPDLDCQWTLHVPAGSCLLFYSLAFLSVCQSFKYFF